ncbi:MAG TPA: STAS domain-containing protein [Phycisphaerales bacterium]|nr:STAS domain-containing protein [Phycisphaerales bacterium]
MPQDWEPGILLSELSDEPELSEEFASIFARLKGESDGGGRDEPWSTPGRSERAPGAGPSPAQAPVDLVLNFQGVSYLNSSHIAALLRMRKLVSERGRRMVLCGLRDEVWSMLMVTGLDKIFTFEPDTMTALARIQIDAGR